MLLPVSVSIMRKESNEGNTTRKVMEPNSKNGHTYLCLEDLPGQHYSKRRGVSRAEQADTPT
jgi:hypothetical protein